MVESMNWQALERSAPLLFVLMWSSGAIFVKLGLENSGVVAFLLIRAIGALFIISLLVAWISPSAFRDLTRLSWTNWLHIVAIGIVLQVAYQLFFFSSIDSGLTPGMLSIILGVQPLLTPLLERRRIGPWRYTILGVGFIGLALAVYGGHSIGASTPLSLLLGVGAAISITCGTILQQKIGAGVLVSVIGQYLVATVAYLIFSFFFSFDVTPTLQFAVSATWMIVVVSAGAILLLVFMLSRNSASEISALFYLVPILTYALDFLVFDDPVGWLTILGGSLVVLSVFAYRSTYLQKFFPKSPV